MPRRPTVSRTMNALDVEYKYYDRTEKTIAQDVYRAKDTRMSEARLKAVIENQFPDRRVVEIVKMHTIKVTYVMEMADFMKNAKCV